MEAKSKQRTARFSKDDKRDVNKLKYRPLMGNVPRISAVHTHKDAKFLGDNGRVLRILQRKMS